MRCFAASSAISPVPTNMTEWFSKSSNIFLDSSTAAELIETPRSETPVSSLTFLATLNAFSNNDYPNEIGPGVYDIHSPRVPAVNEIKDLISVLVSKLPSERLWINPDCGLKTRGWDEVKASLKNMVDASSKFR